MFSDETPNIFHKKYQKRPHSHFSAFNSRATLRLFIRVLLRHFVLPIPHSVWLVNDDPNFVSHINLQLNIIYERINNNCYKIEILSHCKFIRIHSHEFDVIYYWSHRIIMRKLGKFKLHISYTLWQLKHQIEQNVILISEHNNSKCLLKKIVLYLPQKNLLS